MSEFKDLMKVMQQQMQQQQQQLEAMERQHQQQMDALLKLIQPPATVAAVPPGSTATPSFAPFDSSSETWPDYWARFCTFTGAHSVPDARKAQVFLTNQSATTYKLLANLGAQQTPPKDINQLTMDEIVGMMKEQFDPKRFVVRERFKFWSDMHEYVKMRLHATSHRSRTLRMRLCAPASFVRSTMRRY